MGWQCGCLPSRTENGHYRVSGPSGLLNDSLLAHTVAVSQLRKRRQEIVNGLPAVV